MTFTYETQGNTTFLVYEVGSKDSVDTVAFKMLQGGVPGTLPLLSIQIDGVQYFKYNITTKISAADFLARQLQRQQAQSIMTSLVSALLEAEKYMLDLCAFRLDTKHVYVDPFSGCGFFVVVPLLPNERVVPDFYRFFHDLFQKIKPDDESDIDYYGKCALFLNQKDDFSILRFKEKLEEVFSQAPAAAFAAPILVEPPTPVVTPPPVQPPSPSVDSTTAQPQTPPQKPDAPPSSPSKPSKTRGLFSSKTKPEKPGKPPKNKKPGKPKSINTEVAIPGQPAEVGVTQSHLVTKSENLRTPSSPSAPAESKSNAPTSISIPALQTGPAYVPPAHTAGTFGETTLLAPSGSTDTVLLTPNNQPRDKRFSLVRRKTGETIHIVKTPFCIGREQGTQVDYVVTQNPAIGRTHANLVIRDGACFISDMNTRNHTYVNGQQIAPSNEQQLRAGDVVCLADDEFDFKEVSS